MLPEALTTGKTSSDAPQKHQQWSPNALTAGRMTTVTMQPTAVGRFFNNHEKQEVLVEVQYFRKLELLWKTHYYPAVRYLILPEQYLKKPSQATLNRGRIK